MTDPLAGTLEKLKEFRSILERAEQVLRTRPDGFYKASQCAEALHRVLQNFDEVQLAVDQLAAALAETRPSYLDGQARMRARIVDVLRTDHPHLADMVEKLPLWTGETDEMVTLALEDAQRVTKPLVDVELDGERITSDTLNFRMGQALAETPPQDDDDDGAMALGVRS